MPEDYSQFEEQPSNADFSRLSDLVKRGQSLAVEIEAEELATAQKKDELRQITHKFLPDLMKQLGLKKFTTPAGVSLESKDEINAHISAEHSVAAINWLDQNGHGGLVKRAVTVEFNREQADAAKELMLDLQKKYPAVSDKCGVNPMTLKAWVARMHKEGHVVPVDLFGIFRQTVVKIPEKKTQTKNVNPTNV